MVKKKIIKKKTTKNKKQIIKQSVVINLHKEQKRQQRRGVAPRNSIRGAPPRLDPLSTPLYIQNPTSNNLTGSNFFDKLNEFQQRLNEREKRLEHQAFILQHHRKVERMEEEKKERDARQRDLIKKISKRREEEMRAKKEKEDLPAVQNRAELGNFTRPQTDDYMESAEEQGDY
jgi:hypothetical protein